MSKIKSALEIALEKTSDLKIDKEALREKENRKKGQIFASLFINENKDFSNDLKALADNDRKAVCEGVMETLLANIVLPRNEAEINKLESFLNAFLLISSDKERVQDLFNEFTTLFNQYISNTKQLLEHLKTQLGPQLEMKARQMEQQTGQKVEIRPEEDPEFLQILSEQSIQLEAQYKEVLSRGKEELKNTL